MQILRSGLNYRLIGLIISTHIIFNIHIAIHTLLACSKDMVVISWLDGVRCIKFVGFGYRN
jgi:hypothetical protein